MATNFPTSLDSLTNPTTGNPLSSPSHAGQHANANDAIEALEAKVGVNSSAVTTSHDYKIAQLEANNSVTNARLRDSSALSVIGRSANSTGDPADIAAGTDGHVLRRSGTTLGFGTVATAGIADGAVTNAKLGADAVTSAKIADNAINSEHYVNGSIDREHLAADVIDSTKLADNAVNSEHYVDGSIDRVHLSADIIDSTKLADNAVNSEHYVDGSIDNVHIANNQITQAKISTTDYAGMGMVFIKSQTIGSGVSSVTVTNAFSSTFYNYRIIMSGVDTTQSNYSVEFNLDGATLNYYWAGWYRNYVNTMGTFIGNSNQISIPIGYTTTTDSTSCEVTVFGPYASRRTHMSVMPSAGEDFVISVGAKHNVVASTPGSVSHCKLAL